jgi:hypothetical protein
MKILKRIIWTINHIYYLQSDAHNSRRTNSTMAHILKQSKKITQIQIIIYLSIINLRRIFPKKHKAVAVFYK